MPGVRRILPTSAQQAGDTSPDTADEHYIIANNNRWSRVVLNYQNVASDSWCEFRFQIDCHPDEDSRNVQDFAAIGFDFLTEDGSSIEFAYVPGLMRSQIDPHTYYIAGPDLHEQSRIPARLRQVRCAFLAPSPTRQVLITIRSWRNTHPFTVRHPTLCQIEHETNESSTDEQAPDPVEVEPRRSSSSRYGWRTLNAEPSWFKYAVVPGRRFFVRGQVINLTPSNEGALVRVIFRDTRGEELPPPYPETLLAAGVGAFIKIPAHRQTRRFTLELLPPTQAATLELGFQSWRDEASMELVTPLETALEDDFLLETISGEDLPDALTFLNRLLERLNPSALNGAPDSSRRLVDLLIDRQALASPLTILSRLNSIQQGERSENNAGEIRLPPFPAWTIPEHPTWTEDPFQSPAWRLRYHSLTWLLAIGEDQGQSGHARALDLALSWSRSNPWGDPADVISAHPTCMAARSEALLQLLSRGTAPKQKTPPDKLLFLFAETVRHCYALSQIVSQNVLPPSISQLRAACALLALARALPRIPLASYWVSLALTQLRDGFDKLIGPEGALIEQSQHNRLEILSLGFILMTGLEEIPDTQDFRHHLAPRLKEGLRTAIAITDPAGMLPPFGDILHGPHHAAWIRRLISGYGRHLLLDESITAELAYPHGSKIFVSPDAGLLAARHYTRKPDWGYLCTSFHEQRHEHGHFDCTSFVYAAGGVRWITDPGGSSLYDIGSPRQYLVSSRAHNIAIPDGLEQMAGTGWLISQTSLEGAQIFEIGTNVYGPNYSHRRIIACLNDLSALAVFDSFTTSLQSIAFDGYLHFEADVTAAIVSPRLVVGFRRQHRLRIIPRTISGLFGGVAIENGRSDNPASMQGFISRNPGSLEPANVLRYSFSGHQAVCGGVVLAVSEQGIKAMTSVMENPAVKTLLDPPHS